VVALPGALEQIAAALRGGASITEALGALADGRGPLAGDLRRLRARATLGSGLGEALAVWPDERAIPSVRAVAGALAVAATVGGPAAGALDGLAESLRQRQGAAAEARALSAQARLSAIVVGAAPAAYLAFSALVDSDSMRVLLATGAGRTCLVIGLALEVLAIVWMRRIVRTEETM
jgi:tight adherence protein B